MNQWIGRVVELRSRKWRKPVIVRIDDAEIATPNMDSDNPLGIWFWARYA